MASLKEIVTKAVIGKAKKKTTTDLSFTSGEKIDKILGCWIINHHFEGDNDNGKVTISGSYDVNIWYSYDNDTKTQVIKETNNYSEVVHLRERDEETSGEEIIVRSLKQPNCVKVDIDGNNINYTIEKELGIELVGDIKVKIEANTEEEPWDEIVEDSKDIDKEEENIESVNEEFLQDNV